MAWPACAGTRSSDVRRPCCAPAPLAWLPPMPSLKVLITGAFNAGKTRFIRSASDVPPVLTEEATYERESAVKTSTTVALDYGKVMLRDVHIYLFGTPGQERFFFMRELLA